MGWVKFNVDGASVDNSGKERIGGVLRDAQCEIIMKFPKQIRVCDANHSKILAIQEAFSLFFRYLKNSQLKL